MKDMKGALVSLSLSLLLVCGCASARHQVVPAQDEGGKVTLVSSEDAPEPVELLEGVWVYPGFFTTTFEQEYITVLAEALPAAYDVLLFPCEMKDTWGWTRWDDSQERFEMGLSYTLPRGFVGETLVHEWAHVLTWDVPEHSHGPAWGVLYASGYRAVLDPGGYE